MLAEAVRKLIAFFPLSVYQYVGFGSIYFADFSLFHKALGIGDMTSIEQNFSAKERVKFNKPFSCINVEFDRSTTVLPKLDLNRPSIIWLDYDGKLVSDMLSDINTVIANTQSGSLFLITVNAQAEHETDNNEVSLFDFRLRSLENQIGKAKIPVGVEGKDLSPKKLPSILRTIIIDQIEEALLNRNGAVATPDRIRFQQIFNFLYEDGAPMITIGGLLLNENQQTAYSAADFTSLDFCRTASEVYKIDVPSLTTKEIVHLDSVLHDTFDFESGTLIAPGDPNSFIPDEDVIKYAKIYRYYPTFAEAVW